MTAVLPDFEDPPIHEVVIGVKFPPIDGLMLTHFGLFWALLKDEFTTSQEAVPLGQIDEQPVRVSGLPLPRVWLIHEEQQYLLQLQPNLFYFNWRQQDPKVQYPRYKTIKPLFYRHLDAFFTFLEKEGLALPELLSCNLTYINLIDGDPESGLKDLYGSLFPDASWRHLDDRYLSTPTAINWQSTFDMPEGDGELAAKIQSAKRRSDSHPLLRFEINVQSPSSGLPLDQTEAWLDSAHKAIVLSFADLTSEEMQRSIWKRSDGTS